MNIKQLPIIAIMMFFAAACKQSAERPIPTAESVKEQSVPDADQLNYFLLFDSVIKFNAEKGNVGEVKQLNDELTVAPGVYGVGNEVLNLQKEGLYRSLIPFKQNYQVIVYQKDVIKLLSSISWLITHGNTNDNLPDDSLINIAKHDKLYITCERACVFAKNFLNHYSIKSRIIQSRAVDKPNGYDEGHVMLEVLIPDTKKWMAFDIDNNAIFKVRGGDHYLNLMEFKDALADGTLEILPLSIDKKVDISQFKEGDYSFSFYSESITASDETLIKWYHRILEIVLIDNYYYNHKGAETLKKYSSSCIYLDKDAFRKKFY